MRIDWITGTVEGAGGEIGRFKGQVAYPDRTLAPVKPWLMYFDADPLMISLAPPGTKAAVTGIDQKIQSVCGFDRPVNGGYRDYLTLDGYVSAEALEENTHSYLGWSRTLVCLWTRAGSTGERYGNAEMRAVLRGERDEQARLVVQEIDPYQQTYVALLHEADGYGSPDLNPTLYRMAVLRLVRVMVDEAQRLGLTPNQFAVGGLLTGTGMGESLAWRWWDGMPQDLIDSNMVVVFWDTYWQAGQTETPAARLSRQLASPMAAGLSRYVLAESTKVGSSNDQITYIRGLAQLLRDGIVEGVALFHKPDGEMSGPGPIRGEALKELGYRMKEFNRV